MPPIFITIILLYIQKLIFFVTLKYIKWQEYSSNLLGKLSAIENNKRLLHQFWIFFQDKNTFKL